jgi:hypothetical protein
MYVKNGEHLGTENIQISKLIELSCTTTNRIGQKSLEPHLKIYHYFLGLEKAQSLLLQVGAKKAEYQILISNKTYVFTPNTCDPTCRLSRMHLKPETELRITGHFQN